MMKNSKYAYISLLNSEQYLSCLIGVYYGLIKYNSKYPYYILCTESVSESTKTYLKLIGIHIIDIDYIDIPTFTKQNTWMKDNLDTLKLGFTKLRYTQLYQFDKIVCLDTDMGIRDNIDELFNKPNWSAVIDCSELADIDNSRNLNGGLIVLEPRKINGNDMYNFINSVKQFFAYGDQLVYEYYTNGINHKEYFLPIYYNTSAGGGANTLHNEYGFNFNNIKVIHFLGEDKPGNYSQEQLVFFMKDCPYENRYYGNKISLEYLKYMNNAIKYIEKTYQIKYPFNKGALE